MLDLQHHAAEQQYYVYLYSLRYATSWPAYVKGYAPNVSFDYGNRVTALWLERYTPAGQVTTSAAPVSTVFEVPSRLRLAYASVFFVGSTLS